MQSRHAMDELNAIVLELQAVYVAVWVREHVRQKSVPGVLEVDLLLVRAPPLKGSVAFVDGEILARSNQLGGDGVELVELPPNLLHLVLSGSEGVYD